MNSIAVVTVNGRERIYLGGDLDNVYELNSLGPKLESRLK